MQAYEYVRDDMAGKTCVVTGANSGIGFVVASRLAAQGAKVVMVCRNQARGERARDLIIDNAPIHEPELVLCDFARLSCVRDAAATIGEAHQSVDVLLNNAGLVAAERVTTEDGFELTFQVNHLAHFLLTHLLNDRLAQADQGRVITVSSDSHLRAFAGLHLNDLGLERAWSWSPFFAYAHSKLANVMFGYELARRLEGSGTTSNVVHPGGVDTGFGRGGWGLFGVVWNAMRPFLLTPEQGARTLEYLATALEVSEVSGGYFSKMQPKQSSPVSYNEVAQRRLWELSERMVGIA